MEELILTSIRKLAVQKTMMESLSHETLPIFLDCLYDSFSNPNPAVRKECLQLLSYVCSLHTDLTAAHLTRIIAQIVNRLKDSDSRVREACQDTIGALAGIYLNVREEGNNTGSASSMVALFVEPLFDAMGEQNNKLLKKQQAIVQSGAAMCMARMVESTASPPITSFQKLLPRINKLLKKARQRKKLIVKARRNLILKFTKEIEKRRWPSLRLPMTQKRSNEINSHRKWMAEFDKEYHVSKCVRSMIQCSKPCSKIIGRTITGNKTFMLWEHNPLEPKPELLMKNWKKEAGLVRDQKSHGTCWSFAGTDIYSGWRLINKEDVDFRTFSSRYLAFYVDEKQRSIEAAKGKKHHCHGFPIAKALKFMKFNGVPEEDPRDVESDYDCIKDAPERNPQNLYKIGKEVEVCVSNNLKDLYRMLLNKPVGANVLLFHPEFTNIGSGIYDGPKSNSSRYIGVHSIVVIAVLKIEGKLVAVVKNSHGTESGQDGYIKVSLTRMVLGMNGDPSSSPSLLLRDFTGLEIPLGKPELEREKEKKKKRKTDSRLSKTLL